MLTSVNFSLFPGNELLTFATRSIKAAEAKKQQLPVLAPFLEKATACCSEFSSAMERETKNPLTKLLLEKNEALNNAFVAFRSYAESSAARSKVGWSAAAESVLNVIRKHGWSAMHMGYKAKMGVITNIIAELRTKYVTELALIGGNELLDELSDALHDFEATAKQQVEVASTNNEPLIIETRPKLTSALRALFQIIGLQEIASPGEVVNDLINELNTLIVSSISTVRATDTRANTKKSATNSSGQITN